MDLKSLAKSKRAHSQHHSKKHHSKPITVKAQTLGPVGASTANKPSGKGIGEKPHQSQRSKGALPSNRDRYEEDYDSDLDDQSKSSLNLKTDGFTPKSKGVDYKYLLSEAKLQSEANISSESFPSFDDVLSDFNEGFGSLLSARGEGILSWTRDDNFIVDDKATATCQASFLSLNLHLLAEQLEKVDLSRRLFIEPDLFLTELSSDDLRTSDEESAQAQVAFQSQETKKNCDEIIDDDNLKDREAEVDLLLNSFSFNSSDPKKNNDTVSLQHEENLFKKESTSIFNQSVLHSQRYSEVATNFDDDLDNLLKERSSPSSGTISSARSQPFELALITKNFDDDLDDLLVETSSNIKNLCEVSYGHSYLDQSSTNQGLWKPTSIISQSASSSSFDAISKSKLSDDFDSFFDTL